MQSPWGDVRVSDAHVHFFSRRFFNALAAESGRTPEALGPLLGWELPPPEPESFAKNWVTELDRAGVARAALIASVPGDEDSVAAAVSRYPERFYGYFMLNPTAPGAADRAGRALAAGRVHGICLFPAMHRYSIQDECVQPVLEIAAANPGTIVFVHCGVLTVGVRKRLGLPSPFDMRFSNPIDLHAIALRFPQVNFVVPHFGAGYFREALMLCDLCPNVYLDTSSSNSWIRYQLGAVDLAGVFARALDLVGAGRLLFGTDSSFFPRGWHAAIFNTQAQVFHTLGVTGEQAAAIFGGNLERLLQKPETNS